MTSQNNDSTLSPYYNTESINQNVEHGQHRQSIGGLWDELGALQFDFLKSNGLLPEHKLLDIGCGCLRGGIYFVEYLDRANYFGTDMNQSLLDAGYEIELKEKGIDNKLPAKNLLCNEDFDFSSLESTFNFALAVSVFTHLPFNQIRICLERLGTAMNDGGIFFATFFDCPPTIQSWHPVTHQPGNIRTYGSKDPYHYYIDDFEQMVRHLPWKVEYIGGFNHPRNQKMLKFSYTHCE